MTLSAQPFLYCTFAESIRHESSGQISLIGIFNSGKIMMPPNGGITLPQLSIYLAIFIPSDINVHALKFDLSFEGNPIHSTDFPDSIISKINDERSERLNEAKNAKGFYLQTSFSFNNLSIPNPGVLRSSATINSKETIESNGLIFMRS